MDKNINTDKQILLHMCCAPCSIYPVETLREDGYFVEGLFFNPNIQPLEEHNRRKQTLIDYAQEEGIPLTVNDDMYLQEWLRMGADNLSRCLACYQLRMNAAAAHTRKLGLPAFTTTLLVSPYQDHALITLAATRAGSLYGVEFVYKDFRQGFYKGQNKARELGLYRQKYCGCVFSKVEAEEARLRKTHKK